MAFAELFKQRTQVPGLQAPAPTTQPTASPAVPTSPTVDPSKLTAFRQAADTARYYEDQTDTNLLADPRYAQFAQTGTYQPSSQPFADAEGASANFGTQQIAALQAGRQPSQFNYSQMPGFQFDDPYTKQLEDLVRQNLEAIRQPQSNPALDQLTQFLNKQFTDLSTSPGYSPDELALIRTQMLEPIERDRAAGRQRVTERTAARGMLPSSGIHEQELQEFVDRPAEERRVGAQRDIALNAIDRRRGDINQAMNLGKVAGIEIPGLQRAEDQSRRSEALNLSSLLYDLPNRALQENLAVLNGSPGPESLFNQAIALQQQQTQQQALNAQKWSQIGQLIAGLF